MDYVKPLRSLVRPRGPVFAERLATEWLPLFEGSPSIDASPTSDGLLIRCIWYGDLDDASHKLRAAFDGDLTWSEPQIEYRTETVSTPTGATRQITLEPLMTVEVEAPEDVAGTVMGELSSRRGMIQAIADVPRGKLIKAEVPLSELKGYAHSLRSSTGSRATVAVQFSKYSEAPRGQGPWPDEPASAALRA